MSQAESDIANAKNNGDWSWKTWLNLLGGQHEGEEECHNDEGGDRDGADMIGPLYGYQQDADRSDVEGRGERRRRSWERDFGEFPKR